MRAGGATGGRTGIMGPARSTRRGGIDPLRRIGRQIGTAHGIDGAIDPTGCGATGGRTLDGHGGAGRLQRGREEAFGPRGRDG
ncbi:hypothetical protein [Nocardiopsis sp. CC223A]|uniref:hypothetical protein n=1 Tax=Nocardiopsis sp. CC223A TaxID=3044051 RepID=UPI00278BBC1C|nr:hypothetical protein [Nocardiopsis sp. CC223A]